MSGAPGPAEPVDVTGDAALMARHGITRTSVHHYFVDGYRYTSLADALAQAKRSGAGAAAR